MGWRVYGSGIVNVQEKKINSDGSIKPPDRVRVYPLLSRGVLQVVFTLCTGIASNLTSS